VITGTVHNSKITVSDVYASAWKRQIQIGTIRVGLHLSICLGVLYRDLSPIQVNSERKIISVDTTSKSEQGTESVYIYTCNRKMCTAGKPDITYIIPDQYIHS